MAGAHPLGLAMSKSKEHIRLRFQTVVIVSQLPDNTAEALLVRTMRGKSLWNF